jgi:hypothetical protein
MTFEEALQLLRAGHIIRRKEWYEGNCIYLQRGVVKMIAYGNVTRLKLVNIDSVMAEDWEEIEAVKV